MIIKDIIEETYWALSANKVRTLLTMLGIVIGIASVIAMVAVGQGAQGSIQSSIQSIGSNLIFVTPGAQRGVGVSVSAGRGSAQSLTQADVDAISSQVSLVQAVAPEQTRRYQITAPGQNTNTQVVGTTDVYPSVRNITIDTGNFISTDDMRTVARVAVVGPTTRDDLFGVGADPLGQHIRINGLDFKIIGLTKAKGGSGFTNSDDTIYIPITTAQHFLSGNTYISTISVSAQDQSSMSSVQAQVTTLLLARHHIDNPALADFNVINQADIIATASSVTGTFTILLAAIAAISLLVGGIGIMNMMLTTVTERTREIGLRKAIGAKKKDISIQFLMEAIAITFIGGGLGILLGWGAASLITTFAGIASQVSTTTILLAFGVSAGIGIIFGYYPARRAASLNPIEALRFE